MAIQVGSKVKYSANFLRSTGMLTGEIGFVRGTVVEIKKLGSMSLATIDWKGGDAPNQVNVYNLKEVGKPEYFD